MTAISATDTALLNHISDQQHLACQLLGLLEGLSFLHNEGHTPDAVTSLIQIGHGLSERLYRNLDIIALPRER